MFDLKTIRARIGSGVSRRRAIVERRLVRHRLVPTDTAPVGVVASLHRWTLEHAGHCGARYVRVPAPSEPALEPRPEDEVLDHGAYEAALVKYETLAQVPSETFEAAVLPAGRLVTDSGFVVTHDGLLALESAWDPAKLAGHDILARGRLRRAPHARGVHASLISHWCRGYFHWITDALPRIAVLEATGFADAELIVPVPLPAWRRRSLELVGVDASRLTPFTDHLSTDVLIWPRPVSATGHPPAWACRWLRERVGEAPSRRPLDPRRLYLTRRDMQRRRVANEDDVWRVLEPLGFEAIEPGTLTLDEQIALFAAAEIVVAPHGGALTNILFGDGMTVVELFAPTYINTCYYGLAARCGHRYRFLIGTAAGDSDMHIDPSRLRSVLEETIQA